MLQAKNNINKAIKECIDEIQIEQLKIDAKKGLEQFANKQLNESLLLLGVPNSVLFLVVDRMKNGKKLNNVLSSGITLNPTKKITTYLNPDHKNHSSVYKIEKSIVNVDKPLGLRQLGVPTMQYDKEYGARVFQVLDELAKQESQIGGFSLRNKAEILVREQFHKDNIENLKAKGVNLVVCSSHANASKRCQHWQGKYYTLDNTWQNIDGKQFMPLRIATDQFYTTKRGIKYKNGLFGFNCRHYLSAYVEGVEPVNVSAKVVEKERNIDAKMRYYERTIRQWESRAEMYKNVNEKEYQRCISFAKKWITSYETFCKVNKRPIVPSRLKLSPSEKIRIVA